MKCKNCGHDVVKHVYSAVDYVIKDKTGKCKGCDCKQFIPEDEVCKHGKKYYCEECYKEKGCGK